MKAGWKANEKRNSSERIEHYYREGEERSLCNRVKRNAGDSVSSKAKEGYACSRCADRQKLQG